MTDMTSRERLLKCIKHEPVDRVPISTYELNGWNETAWENHEPSYRRLMDAVREQTDCMYMDSGRNFIGKPAGCVKVRKWDNVSSHYVEKIYSTPKGRLNTLHRSDDGVHTVWTLKHMLKGIDDIDKYLSIPYEPSETNMDRFFNVKDKLGEKGVMMISVGDPICTGAELFEMSDFLTHAFFEADKISFLLDALHERNMHQLRAMLKYDMRDTVFRICGPEYATPPYLPPALFNRFVTGYLIDMCREIKSAGAIPRIHCHGKIAKVLDQFALTDAEAIDPIEPIPDGDVDLNEVKKTYGKKFCLMGNIELKELENSNRHRIDDLVRQAMKYAKEGGGFILMPTAAPINVPLSPQTEENYLQMFESALKYGEY